MSELAAVDEIMKNKPPLRLFKYRQVNAATEQLLSKNDREHFSKRISLTTTERIDFEGLTS